MQLLVVDVDDANGEGGEAAVRNDGEREQNGAHALRLHDLGSSPALRSPGAH